MNLSAGNRASLLSGPVGGGVSSLPVDHLERHDVRSWLSLAGLMVLAACGGGGASNGSEATVATPAAPVLALSPQGTKGLRFTWTDVSSETEYRLLENPDGISGYNLVATLLANTTSHQHTVFLPGRVNAHYILQACNSAGCGNSVPVLVGGTLAEAVGYVKASNTGTSDAFGNSVALSADGTTLAVGAPGEDSSAIGINGNPADNSMAQSGAVYVFTRDAGVWSQRAYLKASNPGTDDFFGLSVSLSADGHTLAVGAPFEDSNAIGINGNEGDNSAPFSGAVYVFARQGNTWSQEAYVKASNTGANDHFGLAIALAGDGSTLAVGAPKEASGATGINGNGSDDSSPLSGAVYVFARNASTWSQQAYVKASNAGSTDEFGSSVALAGDGNTLAVGATGEASNATGIEGNPTDNSTPFSGAVYVFSRSAGTWSQQAYVKASNSEAGDAFGLSVSLSADGQTMAVGAFESSSSTGINGDAMDNSAPGSGAVYVFTRSSGTWLQQAYVKASNTRTGAFFGVSVTLTADGNTLAVGSVWESSKALGINDNAVVNSASASGAVYVFTRSAQTWSQLAFVKASNAETDDSFGFRVALASEGNTMAVGATFESSRATGILGDQADNSAFGSGAVYLY